MSVLFPVAENAEAALHAPKGYAARERSAQALAAGEVHFVTEAVGPAFATREAALDAYAGKLDDDRPGHRCQVPPESRWCDLRPVAAAAPKPKARRPVEPVNKDGRRWPQPDPEVQAPLWRLSVSYWRVGGAPAARVPQEPARAVRRRTGSEALDPAVVRALADQPMRAFQPQQPLDIGLFETRPPEAPHIVMPDE